MVLLTSLVFVGVVTQQCGLYSCTNMEGTNCSHIVANDNVITYELKACGEGKVCDMHGVLDQYDVCATSYSSAVRYPGETCTISSECYSGKCEGSSTDEKVCVGLPLDEPCSKDYECAPGLYCDGTSKTCLNAPKEGDPCGTVKCQLPFICNTDKCVKIGSVLDGAHSSSPAACQSFIRK